ncbi:MAG: hypothetical protein HGGPFJEG_03125 [Ignavibacteria bacterium]|nr:hypothetical protein [Ignavibacteria bacterium]
MLNKNQIKFIVLTGIAFLFSGISSAQIFWDQACGFNGTSSSYISVKHSSSLNITGSFTIEMWIYPMSTSTNRQIIQKRNAGASGYEVFLTSAGKVAVKTNFVTRLTGNSVLPIDEWSHIAVRYNVSNDNFSIYINGVLDNSATAAGAAPISNSDSLWIGKGTTNYFEGTIDNLRIWDTVQTPTQVDNFYRSIIATNSGKFSHLVLSMPFQPDNSAGDDFTLNDMTSRGNDGINRGVIAVDFSNKPSVTTTYNDCIELDGDADYLAGPANSVVSPTSEITLEAWVQMDPYYFNFSDYVIVSKGLTEAINTSRYAMTLTRDINYGVKIKSVINGNTAFESDYFLIFDSFLYPKWMHVVFTYSAISGKYEFFYNGISLGYGINNQGSINSNSNDSLYIGNNFEGFIDEVRISNKVKSIDYIHQYLFQSIEDGNDSSNVTEAVYNFDGYLTNSAGDGPALKFRNDADFSHSARKTDRPVSPLIRSSEFMEAFYVDGEFINIPASDFSTDGYTINSLGINEVDSITDINVFVAMNHTQENSLRIVLFSPEGDSCTLFNQDQFESQTDNIITIFDDQSSYLFTDLDKYVAITPRIRPKNNLNSAFSGAKTHGSWKLKIYDFYLGDVGMLYSWGIQINNHSGKKMILETQSYIQGFYNADSNTTISDTIRCRLRNSTSPYAIVATKKDYFSNTGIASFDFTGSPASPNVSYFIQLEHRNSIETWSAGSRTFNYFSYFTLKYNFYSYDYSAYGDNQIKVDISPTTWAFYGGDVNQDGVVDATDNGMIDNDASNFVTGYVITDITGDDVTDAIDAAIADNNAANFVAAVTP